ncbi:MAG: DUF4982 domain-containing protein [Prolixibacteraceae bacterium]
MQNKWIIKIKGLELVFGFVILLSLLFVKCNNSNQDEVHTIVNLGETPWKFKKVETDNEIDCTNDFAIQFSKDNNGYSILLNPKKTVNQVDLKVSFKNDQIHHIFYLLEGKLNDGTWISIADHREDSKLAVEITKATVAESGETVGLVNKIWGKYFNEMIDADYQAFRLSELKSKTQWTNETIIEKPELKLSKRKITRQFASVDFDDSNWQNVGIPHCFNDNDTYLNASDMFMWRGEVWYRKKIFISEALQNKNFILEFQGINTGAAIYVNGQFFPGNSAVKQPDQVTHVGGFLPFCIDITKALHYGEENLIAVRVSNETDGFFTNPGFGIYEGFGMGWGGITCPVYLHQVNQVHIPVNAYSPSSNWGNYIATIKASDALAQIRILSNVENSGLTNESIVLSTEIYDDKGKLIKKQTGEGIVTANNHLVFDFKLNIEKPQLWYPNNSPYGTQYLYTLKTKVLKKNKVIDEREDKIGIRTITWDADYCYVNGKKHFLQGFGHRNSYPALGSAVPAELQWKDIELIARAGGNTLRVGHVPATKVMVEACDAYGIMVMQNSGDNEWVLKGEPALTYKAEYDREMITAFRNHPSIAVWESNNGLPKDGNVYPAFYTYKIAQELDSLQARIIHNRDEYPANWPDSLTVMVGYTNAYTKVKGSPTLNTEVYGAYWDGRRSWNIARNDYQNEVAFTDFYVNDYLKDIEQSACGWIDWMLAETQGEGYTTYLNGMSKQKSLGSCAMDGNRIPKLKYSVYEKALWNSFAKQPGVALQSSWNLSGIQTVSAWSNCPEVELFLNNKSLGKQRPDEKTRKCEWNNIQWGEGTLKVVGLSTDGQELCSDLRVTAKKPHHIELKVEKPLIKPNGQTFQIKANGSDAAIITARILDEDGNLCVQADNNIVFSVEGPAIYRGSYNFYITPNQPLHFHAPGDYELAAEGGMMRVAVKSTFKPGTVTLKANSEGLVPATASYQVKL